MLNRFGHSIEFDRGPADDLKGPSRKNREQSEWELLCGENRSRWLKSESLQEIPVSLVVANAVKDFVEANF